MLYSAASESEYIRVSVSISISILVGDCDQVNQC